MRFLVDMPLSPAVAAWLREAGHDAYHLHDVGLDTLSDGQITARAEQEQRVILTCDVQFGALALQRQEAASVMIFRIAKPTPFRVIERTARTLEQYARQLQRGAIIVIEERRSRLRRLRRAQQDE
jgi:predicted nuclease of predicted toxin-antitoxin system